MSDQKPTPIHCPFCGSDELHVVSNNWVTPNTYVQCDHCRAIGPSATTPAEAIAKWNQRHHATQELREILDEIKDEQANANAVRELVRVIDDYLCTMLSPSASDADRAGCYVAIRSARLACERTQSQKDES